MKIKNSRGSSLVVALILLTITLLTALSIALVSIRNRRASMEGSRSNQAFQTADIGIEVVMRQVVDNTNTTIGNIETKLRKIDWICNSATGEFELSAAALESKGWGIGLGSIKVTMIDMLENPIDCDAQSGDPIINIVRLKSEGTVGNDVRVIEAAVDNTTP